MTDHDDVPAGWYEEDGQERYWDGADWTDRYRPLAGAEAGGPKLVEAETSSDAHIEYKVLTQKDRFFGGKFDPMKLEEALNAYSHQGWAVSGIATADIAGWSGSRQELIVVMSRPR
jgi:hypothetical protein